MRRTCDADRVDTGTGDDTLSGTWFVVRTSLPFWRGRTHAAITYAPLPFGVPVGL